MEKEEFIEQFAQLGHRTEPSYENPPTGYRARNGRYDHEMVVLYMDAAPCDCGATECDGWKMHSKTLDPPSDCGIDPLMMHGPFGPPYSLMSREDQESVGLVPGGVDETQSVEGAWKRLADVKPAHGQLVEYRGENWHKEPDKSYSFIDAVPRTGHFTTDCGTSWSEQLDGFTTEKRGVIVAPDPAITFWRAMPTDSPMVIPNRPDDEPGFGHAGPDSGVASKEPMKIAGMDLPFHWHFILDGKTVGELCYDEETEKLEFSGDVDASAKILFDLVTERFAAWHKDKYGE